MCSRTKFQNNSFVRYIVSRKNVKRTFLSSEPLPNNFAKILLYDNQVTHGTSLCVEFCDYWQKSLGEELQKNYSSGRVRALLNI